MNPPTFKRLFKEFGQGDWIKGRTRVKEDAFSSPFTRIKRQVDFMSKDGYGVNCGIVELAGELRCVRIRADRNKSY